MNKYYIYKLKNVDLHDRVKRFPPNFKFNYDFAYLIMHFILESMSNKIQKNVNSQVYKNFNPLDSRILQKYNHDDYRVHIRYLCENIPFVGNILERIPYSKGQNYSYRFRPQYQYQQLEIYTITNKTIVKKLLQKDSLVISNKFDKNYCFLTHYFNKKRLTVKFQDALNLNADELEEHGNFKNYLSNAYKILRIQNGNYYMTNNPETDGRVHSNITGFPKKFRKFLSYDDEKLVEIDISASVPNFLFYLLSNLTSSSISHLNKIILNKKLYCNHYMLVKNSVSIDSKEIQKLGKEISEGTLYCSFLTLIKDFFVLQDTYQQWQFNEYFFPNAKSFSRKPVSKTLEVSDSKIALLSMLNAKNRTFILEELSFKSEYPTIFKFLYEFKKKEHTFFSHLILQIESYFMLKIIAKQLSNKSKKKIPILTLHDCIVTTESKINIVKDFMESTFQKELGFIPKMKTKVWT